MIFEKSWESGGIPIDWKLANIVPVFKDKKDDPGNCRPVSLTSVSGEITEKILLGGTEKLVIDHSQHGLMSRKSCLSNLISFYHKVMILAHQGKPGDVILLDFSKTFHIVSHSTLLDQPRRILGCVYRLGNKGVESSTVENILVDGKVNLSQLCPGSQQVHPCPGVHQAQPGQLGKEGDCPALL